MAAGAESVGGVVAANLALKQSGSRETAAGKGHTGDASAGTSHTSGKDLALESRSYYNTCRWVDDLEEPSQPDECPSFLPPSPDFIPNSDLDNNLASNEVDRSEEDLASVPSTVQVGIPESEEPRDLSSPRKPPRGS